MVLFQSERSTSTVLAVLRIILIGILLLLIARAFWRVVDGMLEGAIGARGQMRPGTKLVRDPVCGTFVAPSAALSLTSGPTTHYFCSEKCRDAYEKRA